MIFWALSNAWYTRDPFTSTGHSCVSKASNSDAEDVRKRLSASVINTRLKGSVLRKEKFLHCVILGFWHGNKVWGVLHLTQHCNISLDKHLALGSPVALCFPVSHHTWSHNPHMGSWAFCLPVQSPLLPSRSSGNLGSGCTVLAVCIFNSAVTTGSVFLVITYTPAVAKYNFQGVKLQLQSAPQRNTYFCWKTPCRCKWSHAYPGNTSSHVYILYIYMYSHKGWEHK